MIAKVCKRGARSSGLLRYLTGDNKAGHVRLDDASAARLDAPSSVRPDITRPIWHVALSLPAGERLSPEKWQVVADDFLQRMELGSHERAVVIHRETEHEHAHIVINRIGWDGTVWAGEFDGKQAIQAAKAVEQAHGLAVDRHRPTGRAALSQPEIEQALRTGTQPTRTTLQELVDAATSDRCSTTTFLARMEAQGVQVLPNIASTGRVSGLAFVYNGETVKASALGKNYSWNRLQTRIDYEQDRDGQALQERARGGAGGAAARPDACRPNRGRTGELGPHDDRDHQPHGRRTGQDNSARQDYQRQRDASRQDADSNRRSADQDSERMGPGRHEDAAPTVRPVSALARSRGPVSGAWQRVRDLAASLRARLTESAVSDHGHDRHGPARAANRGTVAAVSAGLER